MAALLLVLILLAFLFFGLGFAIHVLWWVAVFVAVAAILHLIFVRR